MILENIIKNCGVTGIAGDSRREISSICIDSRKATPGSMFIAVKGHGTDGHQFIASAIKAGAAAIMFEDRQALRVRSMSMTIRMLRSWKSRIPDTLLHWRLPISTETLHEN